MCLYPAAIDGIALYAADSASWARYAAVLYAAHGGVVKAEAGDEDDGTP